MPPKKEQLSETLVPISQTPDPTVSETRTRSGRVVKKPERYTPIEVCEDDYASDEYDTDESSDVSSDVSVDPEDISSESDADEYGNLKDFIVDDVDVSGSESGSGTGTDADSD